jgi:AAHS family 4-hydroxybenzoate transporter-like MFS transporter
VVKQQPAQRIAAILKRIAPLPEAVEFGCAKQAR